MRETPKSLTHRPNSVSQREPWPEQPAAASPSPEKTRGTALGPAWGEDMPPPKDKGGCKPLRGDRRGEGVRDDGWIAVARTRACQRTCAEVVSVKTSGAARSVTRREWRPAARPAMVCFFGHAFVSDLVPAAARTVRILPIFAIPNSVLGFTNPSRSVLARA